MYCITMKNKVAFSDKISNSYFIGYDKIQPGEPVWSHLRKEVAVYKTATEAAEKVDRYLAGDDRIVIEWIDLW